MNAQEILELSAYSYALDRARQFLDSTICEHTNINQLIETGYVIKLRMQHHKCRDILTTHNVYSGYIVQNCCPDEEMHIQFMLLLLRVDIEGNRSTTAMVISQPAKAKLQAPMMLTLPHALYR